MKPRIRLTTSGYYQISNCSTKSDIDLCKDFIEQSRIVKKKQKENEIVMAYEEYSKLVREQSSPYYNPYMCRQFYGCNCVYCRPQSIGLGGLL